VIRWLIFLVLLFDERLMMMMNKNLGREGKATVRRIPRRLRKEEQVFIMTMRRRRRVNLIMKMNPSLLQ